MDNYVPSKRELHKMIKAHGVLLVLLMCSGMVVVTLLIKKGVLTSADFKGMLAD